MRRSIITLATLTLPFPLLAQAPAEAVDDGAIIVTAQKRDQRALDVPITLTATSGERLRDLGVSDLDELAFYVPGLNIQEQSANNPGIVIRGITSDSGSAQEGPRVTLYYNGVDIARSRGSYQDIYDIERIEVIKGPQATLFGTASAVGAISIISARPQPGVSGALTAGLGNFDQRLVEGHLNLGNDRVAGRVAFAYKRRDGYVRNLAPGQDDLNGQNQLGIRTSLRFTPDDRLTVDLIGTYDRQRNPGTAFISLALPTAAGPGNAFGVANLGGSPLSASVLGLPKLGLRRDVYDGNLTVNWEFDDDWSLTLVNGYRRFDSLEVFDADGSAAWYLEFAELAKGYQLNQETRFNYTGERFRGSFGFNFFHEDSIQRVPFSSNERVFGTCANPATRAQCVLPDGSVPAQAATPIPYASVFENSGVNTSYSVFADGTFVPTPRLELTAGVRVLIEKRRSGFFAQAPRAVITPNTALIPTQIDTNGETFRAEDSFSAVLPRVNALFRVTDALNVYATVSKGRRADVVQLNAAPGPRANLNPVKGEIVWNYEAGVKFATPMVSASLGAFWQDYKNFQVSVPIPGTAATRTESAGTATAKGVEAELTVRPTSWFSAFGNVAYIDARIDDKPTIAPNFRNARFRLQPEWQASGGFTIDAPLGDNLRVFATPSVTHRSSLFFETPNNPARAQGPVVLANVRAGVGFGRDGRQFEVIGFARNVFNRRYLLDAGNTGGAFGIPSYIPAEPRLYGVQVSTRF